MTLGVDHVLSNWDRGVCVVPSQEELIRSDLLLEQVEKWVTPGLCSRETTPKSSVLGLHEVQASLGSLR